MRNRIILGLYLVVTAAAASGYTYAEAIAVCIGITNGSSTHYSAKMKPLRNPENDARTMREIAENQGFKTSILLGPAATREAVLTSIQSAADALQDGDIFMITFAGHGGYLDDKSGDERAGGRPVDQTWCLFDAQLIDDELQHAFTAFKAGVRVLMFSDSCHSGTMTYVALGRPKIFDLTKSADIESAYAIISYAGSADDVPRRSLRPGAVRETYMKNKAFYDDLIAKTSTYDRSMRASIMSIVACRDTEEASDGRRSNGMFTEAVKTVWDSGKFQGNYAEFHVAVAQAARKAGGIVHIQNAVYCLRPNEFPSYEQQRPFKTDKPNGVPSNKLNKPPCRE